MVVLPDTGFAVEEKGPGTIRDLIKSRHAEVISARKGEKIDQVIEAMRKHGISQMR